MTSKGSVDEATRSLLAEGFEDAANWRNYKAAEYPDDLRNTRSAEALFAAAEYVRTTQESQALDLIVEFALECEGKDIAPWFGTESNRVAGRYSFDNNSWPPNEHEHEFLLFEIRHAMVEDMREDLGDMFDEEDDEPASALLDHPGVAAPDARLLEILTEIRDILRERLPTPA